MEFDCFRFNGCINLSLFLLHYITFRLTRLLHNIMRLIYRLSQNIFTTLDVHIGGRLGGCNMVGKFGRHLVRVGSRFVTDYDKRIFAKNRWNFCYVIYEWSQKKTSNYANKKYSHQKIIMSGCLMMFKANFVRVYNKFES